MAEHHYVQSDGALTPAAIARERLQIAYDMVRLMLGVAQEADGSAPIRPQLRQAYVALTAAREALTQAQRASVLHDAKGGTV
jgi:hypothetical protein